jgi:hypothetical protein
MVRPRTFVKYDENGDILGVIRATVFPEEYESPWGFPGEGEAIVEVDEQQDTLELPVDVLSRRYAIDVDRRKLFER